MLTNTATFLLQQNKISAAVSYGPAINRTYFDAAVSFSPPVDLQGLIKPNVHLALLLDMSGSWDIGLRIAGAAALAVARVNADKTLLPGRLMQYSWADSGCSAQQV